MKLIKTAASMAFCHALLYGCTSKCVASRNISTYNGATCTGTGIQEARFKRLDALTKPNYDINWAMH